MKIEEIKPGAKIRHIIHSDEYTIKEIKYYNDKSPNRTRVYYDTDYEAYDFLETLLSNYRLIPKPRCPFCHTSQ